MTHDPADAWDRECDRRDAATGDDPSRKYGSRPIGTHRDCGGIVMYDWSPAYGHRTCSKCGQSSRRGNNVQLTKEAT